MLKNQQAIFQEFKLLDAKHVNVYDILNSDKLIMTEAAIKAVEEVLA